MLSGISLRVSLQQLASVWKALLQEKSTKSDFLSTHALHGYVLCSAVMASAQLVSRSVENLLDVGTINVLHLAILVSTSLYGKMK